MEDLAGVVFDIARTWRRTIDEQTNKEKKDQEKQEVPEAAPTDLRRHIKLLIAIIGVVVIAWIVKIAHSRINKRLDLTQHPPANANP